ncbi:MAG: fibrillarin-like rRNA/tRNA 2'-O-methyltransferase [Candidatus Micrarchaeota archaeon]|nr:fibrillarin-like rRNA/tRNA 2'-O-methyltransferase [Candidatus Micrarchaeota archaeon]
MIEEKFPGVYKIDGRLATKNLVPGAKVYDEKLVSFGGQEYRLWDIYRSKLGAAIHKGLRFMPIKPGVSVLYLGASTGTTASHVSDIVGKEGTVYCVEFAQRPMRQLIGVCEQRENMLPIMGDARQPGEYAMQIAQQVDVIYQDVAQPDQDEILLKNVRRFLRKEGWVMVAIKSQSIDISKDPKRIFDEFVGKISQELEVEEKIDLAPYDLEHLFVCAKRK